MVPPHMTGAVDSGHLVQLQCRLIIQHGSVLCQQEAIRDEVEEEEEQGNHQDKENLKQRFGSKKVKQNNRKSFPTKMFIHSFQ